MLGRSTLSRIARPAIAVARDRSPPRASLLERFARLGAPVVADEWIATELTSVAGRSAGGLLTRDDLAAIRPTIVRCDEHAGPNGIVRVPWSRASAREAPVTQVVVAVDARGLAAVACYQTPSEGLDAPELGIALPFLAEPVRRGETRVRPGEPRSASAPISLRSVRGVVDIAFGVAMATDGDAVVTSLAERLDAIVSRVGPVPTAAASGCLVLVTRSNDTARVVASA
jgi:hypothetical protein